MANMGQDDASAQIQQMMNFILNEAKDKAEELNAKGMEEFSIEKFRLVNQQKDKIRQEFSRKTKQVETQCAIARSLAINKSRLEKIKARQESLGKISDDVKTQLAGKCTAEMTTNLIVQGLLMLLEDSVTIRCRKEDVQMVQGCLKNATDKYSQVIQKETQTTKQCKVSLDSTQVLPSDCLGGVVLACNDGAIVIDNTIAARLDLVLEQDKPTIRTLLFPTK